MAKLKSKEVAEDVIRLHASVIKALWETENYHKAFIEFKESARNVIREKYGKKALKECSAQFIGYCGHYVYVYCLAKFGDKRGIL